MSKTKTKKKELTVFNRHNAVECYRFGIKSDGSIWQLDDNEPYNLVLSANRVAELARAVSERARISKLISDLEIKIANLPDTMDDDAKLGIAIEEDGSMVEVGCNKVLLKTVMRFADMSAKLASKFKRKSKKR